VRLEIPSFECYFRLGVAVSDRHCHRPQERLPARAQRRVVDLRDVGRSQFCSVLTAVREFPDSPAELARMTHLDQGLPCRGHVQCVPAGRIPPSPRGVASCDPLGSPGLHLSRSTPPRAPVALPSSCPVPRRFRGPNPSPPKHAATGRSPLPGLWSCCLRHRAASRRASRVG
jgi:hypothetical protein